MITTSDTMRTWLHRFGAVEDLSLSHVSEALARVGIATEALSLDQPFGHGLLFFNEVTPQLCTFVRTFSRDGLERMLAISMSPPIQSGASSALSGGKAAQLISAGASDVFAWHSLSDPASVVKARLERWQHVDTALASPLVQNNLVGQSRAWIAALRQVIEVARFTDASVLLTGETGTGKELVARLIHTLDPERSKRDLVILDCTTIVPELSGSELFGHERGAFTGAIAARDGAFALADGGTLFLDEVGELPPALQPQLLRVIQEHTYKRVGSNQWRQTDFRLICATNRDLLQEEAGGRFRRDLFFRIAACTFELPSMRERPDDIIPLARYFMSQLRPDEDPLEFDEPVREYLLARSYPGNVRDLRNLVMRMTHRHVGPGPITLGDVPADEFASLDQTSAGWHDPALDHAVRRALAFGVGLKEIRREVEDIAIRLAVSDEDGNLQRAAHKLGVTDRALQLRRAEQRQRERETLTGSDHSDST